MKEHLESIIPKIQHGLVSEAEIEELILTLRSVISADPAKGKDLGHYFSLIKQAQKAQSYNPKLTWVPAGGGHVALGHKPGGKLPYESMPAEDVSAVLTLLQEKEGAQEIGQQLEKVNIEWIWFPFSASKPHAGDKAKDVFDLYKKLAQLLQDGHKVYVHCSAGIHRTGMITYGLLRYLGIDSERAKQALKEMRAVTAAQVGEERLAWAEQFGNIS